MWLCINMPNFPGAFYLLLQSFLVLMHVPIYRLCAGWGLPLGIALFTNVILLYFVCTYNHWQDIWVVRQLMRQFVDTMFIINNCISSHLWRKENLVRNQKVLKCYQNDCVENFPLFFISLLTVAIVKNSHI